MRSWGKLALCAVTIATLFVAICEPAEARRRFRFGVFPSFGGGSGSMAEKIDKVYDLPDTATYLHDGKYYDIGSFYQVRDGAEVHGAKPVFVLYSGDLYVRLDDLQLEMIAEELGMDPTAGFRAAYAAKYPAAPKSANTIERREGETLEQFRARIRAMPSTRTSNWAAADPVTPAVQATRTSGGLGAGSVLMVLMLAGIIIFAARKALRGRIAAAITEPDEPMPDRSRTLSFDQRVAERLREAHAHAAPQPAAAGPRTFGRRTT